MNDKVKYEDKNLLIKTNSVSKKHSNSTAVDSVDMSVYKGDIYGLVGKNGAGKTTLFKILLGLTNATSGNVSLFGNSSEKNNTISRKKIGSFIGPVFFPYLTAKENLKYYSKIKGVSNSKEIPKLLELVGLKDVKKPFSAFSLGMKQRLGLANALIGNPELIILDEPVNGLDPEGIVEIRKIIKKLHEENGITFIISSHILNELEMVATTFGFLNEGKLVKEINQNEFKHEDITSIVLEVDDVTKTINILESLGVENITLKNEEEIIINSPTVKSNDLAKKLVENNINLFKLNPKIHTLEDYFFDIIGG
ncbi:ABC-2 type transport system ATP-binding protein [Anaerosphaera aminiphila DSM 21120]|uniref:ABC-2 type transport system ATP-binding protein n=1 Tax=Anaerosphaera aminiphila DSM 21120 TaxID=1120995 RepID=A0A1M5RAP0_9FIRM|nr:ATP-binding cassette domain-containing protein [Anaerosphaera aminiphila]SHH22883.1 ABC-2 type transport system ATP-binding protein [Anaerosphaera aminiphila DSM 21120]